MGNIVDDSMKRNRTTVERSFTIQLQLGIAL